MDTLGVYVGILFIASFIFQGFLAWLSIDAYLGVRKRVPIDLSDRRLVPSGKTAELITRLGTLGFHRLGEATIRWPFRNMRPIWVLVSSDHSIQAETVFNRVVFSTFFGENVLVATNYPNGEHLQTPTYQCRTITTSVEDALSYHRLQVEKFRAKFGPPQEILNMPDYVRWDVMGRIHYGRVVLKRFFRGGVAQLAISMCGVVGIAIALWLARLLRPAFAPGAIGQTSFGAAAVLMTICPATILMAIGLALNLWLRYGSRRDSRKIEKAMP